MMCGLSFMCGLHLCHLGVPSEKYSKVKWGKWGKSTVSGGCKNCEKNTKLSDDVSW